jgi:IclR family transcriptional regulator, mhp operon transcriptional activator
MSGVRTSDYRIIGGTMVQQNRGGHAENESVRSLQRGLDILHEVNISGGIRAGEIAQRVDLPRPTVYRLLQTLEQLGYVIRSASDDRFRVSRRASNLGDGYDNSIVVCQSAGPILSDLARRVIWPIDLSTYENAAMVIQETTHTRSPLSIDRGMIGRRLPIMRTSSGRSYLAFCPSEEQRVIVRHLRRLDEPEDRPHLDEAVLWQMLRETVTRGYGLCNGGPFNPKTSSIAVPILHDKTVLGCISLIWITSALNVAEAVRSFIDPMRDAAQTLARQAVQGLTRGPLTSATARAGPSRRRSQGGDRHHPSIERREK